MRGGPSRARPSGTCRGARIVASTDDDLETAPLAGRPLRRLVEAMPKAELHLHLDGSLRIETALELAAHARRRRAARLGRDVGRARRARCRAPTRPSCSRAFDLPIALMQDAEALERITAELVETKAADNVRYVEIRWGPLLHVARGLSLADGIAAVCAGRATAAARTGTVGPADLHGAPLARPGRQRRARRDRGAVPRPGPDRLGPRRARGGLPGSADPRRARSRPRARAACGSRSTPASGAARRRSGARSRSTRSGSPTARAPSTTPTLCAELHRPRRDARPLPDLELAGRHRAVGRGASARPAPSARRAGDALDRRHDGLRHHPVRGVRNGASSRSG